MSKSTPAISCVINGHREGSLIYRSLKSARRTIDYTRACGLEVELIVVLDRPDEDTQQVVERELREDGNLHIVDFGDTAKSRNHGVGVARGRYIAFLDGDDLWCRSWLVDAFLLCHNHSRETVIHPEFSVYFGNEHAHTLHHVDMESSGFETEYFLRQNYWTALAFSARQTYLETPYRPSALANGFGFEDWTWNYDLIQRGVIHKIAPATSHYIRWGKTTHSVLTSENGGNSVPRVLDLYREDRAA